MRSAASFADSSNPRAQAPTTKHTPSGFWPHLACLTIGDAKPMQSTTSLAVIALGPSPSSFAPRGDVSSCVPFGRTEMPDIAVFSSTTPPFASKLPRTASNSRLGLTPVLRISLVTIAGSMELASPDGAPDSPS